MKTVGAFITLLPHVSPEQFQYLQGYSDALGEASKEKYIREGNLPMWKAFYWEDQHLIQKAKDLGVFDEEHYKLIPGRHEEKTYWTAVHEKTGKVYKSKKTYGSAHDFLVEEEEFYGFGAGKVILGSDEDRLPDV